MGVTLTKYEIKNIKLEELSLYEQNTINYVKKPYTLGIATELIEGKKKYLIYLTDINGFPFGLNVPTESLKEALIEAKNYIQEEEERKKFKKERKERKKFIHQYQKERNFFKPSRINM